MSDLFADRLLDAIAARARPSASASTRSSRCSPTPSPAAPPSATPTTPKRPIDAIFEFTTRVLKIVAPHVPVVKFQSAYFEKYLWEGVEAYYSLIQEAKELGLLVIGDVKRGDIGSTAAAYAAAHLADPPFDELEDVVAPDAITVNPMLGLDTIEPFVDAAKDDGKGLFVLVRTSNPGSAELQDVKLEDGRTWSEMLADDLRAHRRAAKAWSAPAATAPSAPSSAPPSRTPCAASASGCPSRSSSSPATARRRDRRDDPGRLHRRQGRRSSPPAAASSTPTATRNTPTASATTGNAASSRPCST